MAATSHHDLETHAAPAETEAFVVLGGEEILAVSGPADRLLGLFFPERPPRSLPAELRTWLRRRREGPPGTLAVVRPHGRLDVRYVAGAVPGQPDGLVLRAVRQPT